MSQTVEYLLSELEHLRLTLRTQEKRPCLKNNLSGSKGLGIAAPAFNSSAEEALHDFKVILVYIVNSSSGYDCEVLSQDPLRNEVDNISVGTTPEVVLGLQHTYTHNENDNSLEMHEVFSFFI